METVSALEAEAVFFYFSAPTRHWWIPTGHSSIPTRRSLINS